MRMFATTIEFEVDAPVTGVGKAESPILDALAARLRDDPVVSAVSVEWKTLPGAGDCFLGVAVVHVGLQAESQKTLRKAYDRLTRQVKGERCLSLNTRNCVPTDMFQIYADPALQSAPGADEQCRSATRRTKGGTMGVAETVRSLANAVDQAKSPSNPRHRICLALLRLMPEYRDIGDLPGWESAYQGALEERDDESEIAQLLWEVFDFGRLNMYARFEPEITVQEFENIAVWLAARGVAVPNHSGLSDW